MRVETDVAIDDVVAIARIPDEDVVAAAACECVGALLPKGDVIAAVAANES